MNKLLHQFYDCHMHTLYSGDSDTPMENMILAAKDRGLGGIIFTDHLDLDYAAEPHLFDLDLDRYQSAVSLVKEKFETADFFIGFGIELGLQPHLVQQHHEIISKYNFDYVIGSSHVVDGVDPYYPEYFKKLGNSSGIRRYFESIIENTTAFHEMDSYGHLDYIIRYLNDPSYQYHFEDFKDQIKEVLLTMIHYDIALEINTGAFRCGLAEPNPSMDIIHLYKELGGRKITIGADAHKTEHVGLAFEKLPDILKSCGFQEYVVFKNRTPQIHKIS